MGYFLPGNRIETYHISNIDPFKCLGYQNIIIHVGVNDIRDKSPGRQVDDPAPSDIVSHFEKLKEKIELINILCPKSSVFVLPVLPCKVKILNMRASRFNQKLVDYSNFINPKIRVLDVSKFVKDSSLNPIYGCYNNPNDKLHLGSNGIKKLVEIFKENISCFRYRDRRAFSSVLSGRGEHVRAPPQP